MIDENAVKADREFSARYELTAPLGAGNMGRVWSGIQRALGRPVAIKFMSDELAYDREYRTRFEAEARVVAGLIHSHVTAVFDCGSVMGVPYLVTELVTGEPLSALLARPDGLSPIERFAIAEQVLSALEAVHEMGIVHRDLKPSNIMVSTRRPPHAKLMDFGIAKKIDEERGLTRLGIVLGTPHYMSPEQAAGQKLSPASDFYALGVVLYEMVLGRVPFGDRPPAEALGLRLTHDPPVPGDLLPSVATLLRRALSRSPERLTTAAAFRTAFEAAARDVRAVGDVYPAARTLVKAAFLGPTAAGTVAGTFSAPPVVPPREVPAPIAPTGDGPRRPLLAVLLVAGLLGLAVAARRARRGAWHSARHPLHDLSGQPASGAPPPTR